MEIRPDISEALQRHFGFSALRKGQDEVVAAVMEGRDTLAIMPTGGGKSLCYQLPALCREGLVIVVSPLIALMKDQVDALQAKGIAAAAIHSGLSNDDYRQVMDAFYYDELKILYVAPERFGQEGFMNSLSSKNISLLAVDEAHCLSQWGHDFRPDYMRLGYARERLGFPQTMALTATATQQVREDVLSTLKLQDPAVIISGFARENLDFAVIPCDRRKDKYKQLHLLIEQYKTGIIYCSTRKSVSAVFEELKDASGSIVAYHAGMTDDERTVSQNAFISGKSDVVIATNAFGMGIDRADVRFVAHFDVPGSVEAYYQEAGRAGRDGKKSACQLLFNHVDLKTQEFFFEGSNPPLQLIRHLYAFLRDNCNEDNCIEMTVDAIADEMGSDCNNGMALNAAIGVLIRVGAISRYDIPGKVMKGTRVTDPQRPFSELGIDEESLQEKAKRDHLKIESITQFSYSQACRQQWILDYFGETNSSPCGHCDRCLGGEASDAVDLEGERLEIVRKALAGVARASKKAPDGSWQGVFGKTKIMDMLRGSKSETLTPFLLKLTTYGILSHLTSAQMQHLFRAMAEAGLLQTVAGEYPLLTLSDKGAEVMMGRASCRLSAAPFSEKTAKARPARERKERKERKTRREVLEATLEKAQVDKELYDHLAQLRRDIAAHHNLPIFRIMSNETLRNLAKSKPVTTEAACRIKGIGPWMRDNHLAAFIELICDYEGV